MRVSGCFFCGSLSHTALLTRGTNSVRDRVGEAKVGRRRGHRYLRLNCGVYEIREGRQVEGGTSRR